jgi:P27 family predicted phage terminase small subunit
MGRRGPKPKPTALKKLLGNPGKRALNEHEPIPPEGEIKPPPSVRAGARKYWDYYAPILVSMRVLTVADVGLLGRYCNLLQRYEILDEFLMAKGPAGTTYALKDKNGKARGAQEIPQAWEYRQVHGQLLAMERELGLTPSSRTRLRVENAATSPMPAAAPTLKDTGIRAFFAAGGVDRPPAKPAEGA